MQYSKDDLTQNATNLPQYFLLSEMPQKPQKVFKGKAKKPNEVVSPM